MKQKRLELSLKTNKQYDIVNITTELGNLLKKSGFSNGFAIISSKHTTAGVCVNEPCERLKNDVVNFLGSLVKDFKPTHDNDTIDGRGNGRAHLLAHLIPHSEIITFDNGKLNLGTWQALFFIELDGPRSNRNIEITFVGE